MKICCQLLGMLRWNGQRLKSLSELKSASVEERREEGATELQSKIDSLTAILKSSTLAIGKPEGKEKKDQGKTMQKGGKRKSKSTPTTPIKGKGLGTPTMCPSKGNGKPIQCYNCGGWGHGWTECPSKGNFNWRELSGAQVPPDIVEIGPKSSENKSLNLKDSYLK